MSEYDENKPLKKRKKKKKNGFQRFVSRHPILVNALLILLTFIALCYASLLLIDIFTHHGEKVLTPDVRNMPVDEAIIKIQEAGFEVEITDSVYNDDYKPGVVIDQEPNGGNYAKPTRKVFLIINAKYPRTETLPPKRTSIAADYYNDLMSTGFTNVKLDTVVNTAPEGTMTKILVNNVQYNPGNKVPIHAAIVLQVSAGSPLPYEATAPKTERQSSHNEGMESGEATIEYEYTGEPETHHEPAPPKEPKKEEPKKEPKKEQPKHDAPKEAQKQHIDL